MGVGGGGFLLCFTAKLIHNFFIDSYNYKLEKENLCVSELFEMLDSSVKVEIGILDWGIKMTTLEDGKNDLGSYPINKS